MSRGINCVQLYNDAKRLQQTVKKIQSSQSTRLSKYNTSLNDVLPDVRDKYEQIKDYASYLSQIHPFILSLQHIDVYKEINEQGEIVVDYSGTLKKMCLAYVNEVSEKKTSTESPDYDRMYLVGVYNYNGGLWVSVDEVYNFKDHVSTYEKLSMLSMPVEVNYNTTSVKFNDIIFVDCVSSSAGDEAIEGSTTEEKAWTIHLNLSIIGTCNSVYKSVISDFKIVPSKDTKTASAIIQIDANYKGSIDDTKFYSSSIGSVGVSHLGYLSSEVEAYTDSWFKLAENKDESADIVFYANNIYYYNYDRTWENSANEANVIDRITSTSRVAVEQGDTVSYVNYLLEIIIKKNPSGNTFSIELNNYRKTSSSTQNTLTDIREFYTVIPDNYNKTIKIIDLLTNEIIMFSSLSLQSNKLVDINYTTEHVIDTINAYKGIITFTATIDTTVHYILTCHQDSEKSKVQYPFHFHSTIPGIWKAVVLVYRGVMFSVTDSGDTRIIVSSDSFIDTLVTAYTMIALGYDLSKNLLVAELNHSEWKLKACSGEIPINCSWDQASISQEIQIEEQSILWSDYENKFKNMFVHNYGSDVQIPILDTDYLLEGVFRAYDVTRNAYITFYKTSKSGNEYLLVVDIDGETILFGKTKLESWTITDVNKVIFVYESSTRETITTSFRFNDCEVKYSNIHNESYVMTKTAIQKIMCAGNDETYKLHTIYSEDLCSTWAEVPINTERQISVASITNYIVPKPYNSYLKNDHGGFVLAGYDTRDHLTVLSYNNLYDDWFNVFSNVLYPRDFCVNTENYSDCKLVLNGDTWYIKFVLSINFQFNYGFTHPGEFPEKTTNYIYLIKSSHHNISDLYVSVRFHKSWETDVETNTQSENVDYSKTPYTFQFKCAPLIMNTTNSTYIEPDIVTTLTKDTTKEYSYILQFDTTIKLYDNEYTSATFVATHTYDDDNIKIVITPYDSKTGSKLSRAFELNVRAETELSQYFRLSYENDSSKLTTKQLHWQNDYWIKLMTWRYEQNIYDSYLEPNNLATVIRMVMDFEEIANTINIPSKTATECEFEFKSNQYTMNIDINNEKFDGISTDNDELKANGYNFKPLLFNKNPCMIFTIEEITGDKYVDYSSIQIDKSYTFNTIYVTINFVLTTVTNGKKKETSHTFSFQLTHKGKVYAGKTPGGEEIFEDVYTCVKYDPSEGSVLVCAPCQKFSMTKPNIVVKNNYSVFYDDSSLVTLPFTNNLNIMEQIRAPFAIK